MRSFHSAVRPLARRWDGQSIIAFGLRVGYWPCVEAPFVQLTFYKWRIECWHGLPSHGGD